MRVDIIDLVTSNHVILGLKAASKLHLLAELARRAAAPTGLLQRQIADALEAREILGSTGVGAGIAIPHAQISGLDRFYGLFVRLDRPIEYDAIDGRPVDLVFLLLLPAHAKEHLQALASISRRLRDHEIATKLRKAADPREVCISLKTHPSSQ